MAAYHAHAQITATDKGPTVNIASWTLMCVSVLFTGFRIVSNVLIRGQLARDEVFITIATALAIGQVIALSFMVTHGLGQHQDALSKETLQRFSQVRSTETCQALRLTTVVGLPRQLHTIRSNAGRKQVLAAVLSRTAHLDPADDFQMVA